LFLSDVLTEQPRYPKRKRIRPAALRQDTRHDQEYQDTQKK
jgi:hypothetical protein